MPADRVIIRSAADRQALEELRARVVDLAVEFEDANRRGDAMNDLDDPLTAEQAAAGEQADIDYNRSKAELFRAVQALKTEAAKQGVAP